MTSQHAARANRVGRLPGIAGMLDAAIAANPDAIDPDLLARYEDAKRRLEKATTPRPAQHSARRRR